MPKVLILFAHPRFEKSVAQASLLKHIPLGDDYELRDLYQLYPDFQIDVAAEQSAALSAQTIVLQHPFYWYSCPPLLKQWIDLVLEFGWAYGPGGVALKGKQMMQAITTGGSEEAYSREGRNQYSLEEFLRPFERTATLCGMQYLSPFAFQGTHRANANELQRQGERYQTILKKLAASNTLDTGADHDR